MQVNRALSMENELYVSFGLCLRFHFSLLAGFDMPKILHQIMPVRGLIPAIITRTMFSVAPNYMLCMHKADKNLVLNFDNQIKGELLPKWWSNPAVAPTGTQGTKGK
jgi:hypothetical protein